MTAHAAVFDYVSPDRGPRRIAHYRTLNQAHAAAADTGFVQRFLREFNHRNYNRPASAAGPLTPEYAVRLFKPAMTWFVKTQLQLDAMKQHTSKLVQAAKAETKPIPAAQGAKRGFASGAKSLVSRIGAMMSGLSGQSKSANSNPDDDDDGPWMPFGFWNQCSCPEPPKPR